MDVFCGKHFFRKGAILFSMILENTFEVKVIWNGNAKSLASGGRHAKDLALLGELPNPFS